MKIMKFICHVVQVIKKMLKYERKKKLIYWNEEKTDNVEMKTKRWKNIRNYRIIIYYENAMEKGNNNIIWVWLITKLSM
jgi:hypothetical protein